MANIVITSTNLTSGPLTLEISPSAEQRVDLANNPSGKASVTMLKLLAAAQITLYEKVAPNDATATFDPNGRNNQYPYGNNPSAYEPQLDQYGRTQQGGQYDQYGRQIDPNAPRDFRHGDRDWRNQQGRDGVAGTGTVDAIVRALRLAVAAAEKASGDYTA